jgi:hypothetical protein
MHAYNIIVIISTLQKGKLGIRKVALFDGIIASKRQSVSVWP